jgi:hypothetical protein
MRQNIREIYAFMRTIGKISGENHNYTAMERSNVPIGDQGHSYLLIKMDVNKKIDVSIPMDGKSKSTIQITIS